VKTKIRDLGRKNPPYVFLSLLHAIGTTKIRDFMVEN
jgi:hypothetical protein